MENDKKPVVKITSYTDRDGRIEDINISIDDDFVGMGSFGGEPEDNLESRDYKWVIPLIRKLATALGAEVVKEKKLNHDDDDDD